MKRFPYTMSGNAVRKVESTLSATKSKDNFWHSATAIMCFSLSHYIKLGNYGKFVSLFSS
jgi:hypothetical protein